MDTAILSAVSALAGSSIGAIASIGTTWLSQHYQSRAQRHSDESSRRGHLFTEFISLASKLYVDALTHNLTDGSVLVPLYALKGQIYVFAATQETVDRAEEVIQRIISTYYEPNIDFSTRRVANSGQAVKDGQYDILQAFTAAC
jgi:hypothetical protein